MSNKIELYETDYVLVDKNYKPIDSLDICFAEESVYWEFMESTAYTDKEIENKMEVLKEKGEVFYDVDDTVCDWKFVSMTKLPKKLQERYLKFYNDTRSTL
tara:strand:- start:4714 stop:5016 length:303 start_codon:yes stop_codon:yes gene_type:complete